MAKLEDQKGRLETSICLLKRESRFIHEENLKLKAELEKQEAARLDVVDVVVVASLGPSNQIRFLRGFFEFN